MFITVVLHRRIPYLKNLVGQVAPQALPDAYETTKFLLRSDWTLAARGAARVKIDQVKSKPQNIECRRVGSLLSVIFYKIDRIPYFDIRYSLFDILFSRVSFPIRLAVFLASGGAYI